MRRRVVFLLALLGAVLARTEARACFRADSNQPTIRKDAARSYRARAGVFPGQVAPGPHDPAGGTEKGLAISRKSFRVEAPGIEPDRGFSEP